MKLMKVIILKIKKVDMVYIDTLMDHIMMVTGAMI